MAKIISPTLAAAQAAYFKEHNIAPIEEKKPELPVIIHKPFTQGLTGCDKEFAIYMDSINYAAYMPSLTYMNEKDICSALLNRYEGTYNAILGMNGNFERIKQFVFLQRVYKGVCLCARQVFGVNITEHDWMNNFLKGNHVYWCKVPYNCETASEIIQVIKFRVDKLKECLSCMQSDKL